MSSPSRLATQVNEAAISFNSMDAFLGLVVGSAGGALSSQLLASSLVSGIVLGALFGLALSQRDSTCPITPAEEVKRYFKWTITRLVRDLGNQ